MIYMSIPRKIARKYKEKQNISGGKWKNMERQQTSIKMTVPGLDFYFWGEPCFKEKWLKI